MPAGQSERSGPISDRYVIVREIGRGGSATVFVANDLKLPRSVALKILRADVVSTASTDRFFAEIQLASRLNHPHILALLDSGQAGDLPYYVMPFVDGETLRARIDREGQLEVEAACRLAREIADALHYAHAVGVVHRDIKPENILISADHAVVADFGIAKAIAVARDSASTRSGPETAAGTVIGTAAYMSPEQSIPDERIDGRSDIYSLGTVLFEMLCGEPPFGSAPVEMVLRLRLTNDAPRVSERRADVPPDIDSAVARALEREPEQRFLSARDFQRALSAGADRISVADPSGPSIAVLPFVGMSAEKDSDFFVDGMTEEIINALLRLRTVRVAARTSVFEFKNRKEDIQVIGRKLDVRTVLEGAVKRSGDRLRVNATLVSVADGGTLWSDRIERDMGDVFALQDEIARTIVQTLQPSLLPLGGVERHVIGAQTYEKYLLGRHFFNQRDPKVFPRALECYQEAIAADPEFALAYAGAADLYAILAIYGILAPSSEMPKAREAAQRALELDPSTAEPHAALGGVRAIYEWDFTGATVEFQRAIAINPQYSDAYIWYANYVLTPQGRLNDAIRELSHARRFDPLSAVINYSIGMTHYFARRQDQADVELRRVLDIDGRNVAAQYFLGRSLIEQGRFDDGIEWLQRAYQLSGENPMATGQIAYAHAKAGDAESARSHLKMLEALESKRFVSGCLPAMVHAALGEIDEAFAHLERAIEQRAADLLWLGVAPEFDPLWKDPRFARMLGTIGIKA